jgi:hypothetical protein
MLNYGRFAAGRNRGQTYWQRSNGIFGRTFLPVIGGLAARLRAARLRDGAMHGSWLA